MHEATDQTRAPRLTDNRLDDLAVALQTIDDEIDYLTHAILIGATSSSLKAVALQTIDALQRGREWIAGKVAAVRAQRGGQ